MLPYKSKRGNYFSFGNVSEKQCLFFYNNIVIHKFLQDTSRVRCIVNSKQTERN